MNISGAAWLNWPETQALLAAFGAEELRFVGGAVRDTLLNREVTDVDAATPLTPDLVTQKLESAGIRAIPTGLAHGTVTAHFPARSFEITTLRRDVATDGRYAEVQYTTDWAQDAQRRDFTINALYADAQGQVYDPAGGIAHIAPLKLVFIGDASARIREDALRILRFFRFVAQLGIAELDTTTLKACASGAPLIARLSGERIAQEMLKLLAVPALSSELLAQMQRAGIAAQLSLPTPPESLAHYLAIEAVPQPLTRLSAWLSSNPPQPLSARWKLSSKQAEYLTQMHGLRSDVSYGISLPAQKKLLRQLGFERFSDAVRLSWAHNPSHSEAYRAMLKLATNWHIPRFPLTGQDLTELGYAEGKVLGDTLRQLEAEWEAADYAPDRNMLIRMAKQRKAR